MSTEQQTGRNGFWHWLLEYRLLVILATVLVILGGISVAPFNWDTGTPRSPVPVDAIPNLGENQQIVFTEWPGRSPQDVDDQITYPLSVALMGVPGVQDVRAQSMFGFSSIAVIFDENVEFYWSRTRILEKLASLGADELPEGVQPTLGPDATGLGQVYWYTLEGRDRQGKPVGGWDLDEIRSVQDWYVRYGLLSAEGISEVASIGGYVREYQVDVDPAALRYYDVSLPQVMTAVRQANLDVGARTTEINQVEYLVRGVGFIQQLSDIEEAVVAQRASDTPVRVQDVARVELGPAERRGALDVDGAEAVGGVVTVREGANPLAAIEATREQVELLAGGMPTRAVIDWEQTDAETVSDFAAAQGLPEFTASSRVAEQVQGAWRNWLQEQPEEEWPAWLTESTLTIVPFYDRSELIQETLGTLGSALEQQLLITALVILLLIARVRAALVVSLMLPLAVLLTFIGMRLLQVEANIVALAGIAIAIGTIVDMGIILTENTLRRRRNRPDEDLTHSVVMATRQVAPAVTTAIATTVISFLPVFTMTGAEGKLFTPLAYTKTMVLIAAVLLALVLVPVLLRIVLAWRLPPSWHDYLTTAKPTQSASPRGDARFSHWWQRGPELFARLRRVAIGALTVLLVITLAQVWEPLGPLAGNWRNVLFTALPVGLVLFVVLALIRGYRGLLSWCLAHKKTFLVLPLLIIWLGATVWLGAERTLKPVPATVNALGGQSSWITERSGWQWFAETFPGLGREFMPALDEGAFLLMPTTMPHASMGEALAMLSQQDKAIRAIPEVSSVVGKIGRAETALDPAPVSMIETVIHYHPEYRRNEAGELERVWRDHIQSPDDIWQEIVAAADFPGVTSAPKLQPIETRQVMLQTGMRANMGVKIQAPNLEQLDNAAQRIEAAVRESEAVNPASVNAERVIGKPYLEFHPDRQALARHGLSMAEVQQTFAAAVGGTEVTQTVEGRERYPVRVRYQRDLRQDLEAMLQVLVRTPDGAHLPLHQLGTIEYQRGPQMIRSENTFLTAYVTFGGRGEQAEVEVVEAVSEHLAGSNLNLGEGVTYSFAGSYEHQQRASATLQLVIPIALLIIFLLLYLQFKRVSTALLVFSGIAVAWAGGFIMLHLFGQSWFANFSLFGANVREVFQFEAFNLSIAVWVGFLALFGIAVDDGVVMATYLRQRFQAAPTDSIAAIRERTIEAGLQRVRPCLMTSATTVLALLPVLTATGRGADLMIPMAVPTFGGLLFVALTMLMVPVLYCWVEEWRWQRRRH